MKRLVLIVAAGILLTGCLSRNSELRQHDSTWKNWDHMKFSLWGYRTPSDEEANKSQEQGWWGKEVPYIPAQ
ncbi:MAG: hypothetical protein AB1640_09690 [bacterium]